MVSNFEYKKWLESMDIDKQPMMIMYGRKGCGMSLWAAADTEWLLEHFELKPSFNCPQTSDKALMDSIIKMKILSSNKGRRETVIDFKACRSARDNDGI